MLSERWRHSGLFNASAHFGDLDDQNKKLAIKQIGPGDPGVFDFENQTTVHRDRRA